MRIIRRFHHGLLILLTLLLLVGAIGEQAASAQNGTSGATPQTGGGLQTSVEWLISQQSGDGGFPGFEGTSDPGITADALISLAAARRAGVDTGTSIDDAVAYLASGNVALVYMQTGVGQAAKLVLGLIATGQNVDDFAGNSPLSIVENSQDPESGTYGRSLYDHTLAVLALDAGGAPVPALAIDAIMAAQADNGGWGFDGLTDPTAADSNTTSVVIQALVASAAAADQPIADGLAYLASTVNEEGAAAFDDAPASVPDANSTALVAQALLATGGNADAQIAALAGFQNASGAFFFTRDDTTDNLFATVQAIVPLAGAVLPVLPVS